MKYTKRIISIVLVMTLCFITIKASAYAEKISLPAEAVQEEMVSEMEEVQEEAVPEMEEVQEEAVSLYSAAGDSVQQPTGLSLKIKYPSQIKCGEPTTFQLNAEGGSGNYKYRIADLSIYEGSERVSVYDISFGSNGAYKESNEFTFTFYASGTYYIRFSVMDMTTFAYKITGLFEYPLYIQDSRYPSVGKLTDTIAAQCMQECSTDFEKALWLHDWILDHADYDHSYSYCSAEGVLARGRGTCESYHRAYVMLLNKAGIETGRITGNGHV